MLNSWFVVLSLWVSIENKSKFKNTSKANLSIFVVTLRPFNNLIECFDFLSKLNEVCYSGCSEQEQRTARKKKWTTRTERSRSHYFNSIQKVHLNIYITLLAVNSVRWMRFEKYYSKRVWRDWVFYENHAQLRP